MRGGETVNSRIDPTSVGQIKPLQPESHASELREIVWISTHFSSEEKFPPAHTESLLELPDLLFSLHHLLKNTEV